MLATACSNDEVVNVAPQTGAIGFKSFVDNATRADYGSKNLPDDLNVYGVTTKGTTSVVVFNGDKVTNTGSAWTYSPLRYWIADNDYTFAAVAPAGAATVDQGTDTKAGGIKTITFTNNGEVDLLYAAYEDAKGVAANRADEVDFTLGHMLSRIQFEFVNEMPKNYSVKVSEVKITNVVTDATINKQSNDVLWTAAKGEDNKEKVAPFAFTTSGTFVASTKSEVSGQKYLFPLNDTEYKAIAYFEVELKDDVTGQTLKTYKHENIVLPSKFEAGLSYNLKAYLNDKTIDPANELSPIVFTATVTDWEDFADSQVSGFETSKKEDPNAGE